MTESMYMSVTDTAKLVRQALKAAFPGVKFSVRSSSYAGGASIDVGWTDGPQQAEVDNVVKRYAGADFDGMIDLKTSNYDWLAPDGSVLPFQVQVGHSYGSTTYGMDGNPVSQDELQDYVRGTRLGAGVTNTLPPGNPNSAAYKRGLADGAKRVTEGWRLVRFGADYVFSHREFSPEYRDELEHAVLVLSREPGPFDGNKRYSFGVLGTGETAGRAYEDYGNTLVWQLAQHDPAHLADAVRVAEDQWLALRERGEHPDQCATVGCRHDATQMVSYLYRGQEPRMSEKVCDECADSYSRRPVLVDFQRSSLMGLAAAGTPVKLPCGCDDYGTGCQAPALHGAEQGWPLDRSAAHAALLELSEEFRRADLDQASRMITSFLQSWYRAGEKDMFDYARGWTAQREHTLAVMVWHEKHPGQPYPGDLAEEDNQAEQDEVQARFEQRHGLGGPATDAVYDRVRATLAALRERS